MSTIHLPAHFDGKHIQLDKPYDLPANRRLIVVIPPEDESFEQWREDWFRMAAICFERGFGPNEPDYSDCPGVR